MTFIFSTIIFALIYYLFMAQNSQENRAQILKLLFRETDRRRYGPSMIENYINTKDRIKDQKSRALATLLSSEHLISNQLPKNHVKRIYKIPVVNLFKFQAKEILMLTFTLQINRDHEIALFEQLIKITTNELTTTCHNINNSSKFTYMMMEGSKKRIQQQLLKQFPESKIIKLQLSKALQDTIERAPVLRDHPMTLLIDRNPFSFRLHLWINSSKNKLFYVNQVVQTFMQFHFQRALIHHSGKPTPEQLYEIFESFLIEEIKPLFDTLKMTVVKYMIPPSQIKTGESYRLTYQENSKPKSILELLKEKGGDHLKKLQSAKQSANAAIADYVVKSENYTSPKGNIIVDTTESVAPLAENSFSDQKTEIIKGNTYLKKMKTAKQSAKKAITGIETPMVPSIFDEPLPEFNTTDQEVTSEKESPLLDNLLATDHKIEEAKPLENIDDLFDDSMDLTVDKLDF